jgi:hypothetical protein
MLFFFEKIKSFTTVQMLREDENTLHFSFDGFRGYAEYDKNQDSIVPISRINFPFSYQKSKVINKTKVYELVNKINQRIPIAKVIIKKIETTEVIIDFNIEYSIEDKIFQYVDLSKDLDIIISSAVIFEDMLNGNNKFLKE